MNKTKKNKKILKIFNIIILNTNMANTKSSKKRIKIQERTRRDVYTYKYKYTYTYKY